MINSAVEVETNSTIRLTLTKDKTQGGQDVFSTTIEIPETEVVLENLFKNNKMPNSLKTSLDLIAWLDEKGEVFYIIDFMAEHIAEKLRTLFFNTSPELNVQDIPAIISAMNEKLNKAESICNNIELAVRSLEVVLTAEIAILLLKWQDEKDIETPFFIKEFIKKEHENESVTLLDLMVERFGFLIASLFITKFYKERSFNDTP